MDVSTLLKNAQSLDLNDVDSVEKFNSELNRTFDGEDGIKKMMTDDVCI